VFHGKTREHSSWPNVAAAWFNGKELFMKTAKNALKIAGFGLITLMAAACNTVAGAGEDIEAGGSVIQDSADEVKDEMSN
tara:strand:+ start:257 stop:496 length:240 start_codon:yes stop_codon:yes gene_type:complete